MIMSLSIPGSVIDEMLEHAGTLDKLERNNCILIHINSVELTVFNCVEQLSNDALISTDQIMRLHKHNFY